MGPRIYPSYQDTNINAKGSLIINYDEIVNGRGGDNFEIYVNDVLRDKIWLDVEGFYSTHLVLNDVVKLKFPGKQQSLSIGISRKNYTTDDNNDNGLTYTQIDTINQFDVTDYQYTFTATTTNDSYNFEYVIDCSTLQVTPTPLPPEFCKGFNGDVMDIAVQPDGKIIVTGTFTSFTDKNLTTTVCPYITRLTSGGTIDTSFTPSAAVQSYVADGKYYICLLNNGSFILYRWYNNFNFKVSSNGLTSEYLGLGDTTVTSPYAYKMRIPSIDGTGKWYIGGQGFTVGGVVSPIYRYNADGSRDTSFNPPSETRQATAIYELSNGKVIVAVGSDYTYQLNSDGSFDFEYDVYNPSYGYIDNIAEGQSVDKVYFTIYGGLIIRMNTTDGSMDYGFIYNNRGYVSFVQNLGVGTSDDKIIYTSNVGLTLRRMDITGTTDNSFTGNLGSSSGTTVMVKRVSSSSDSMYIFGAFQQWNGYSVGGLFKLNADGSEDFSFYNFLCVPTHTPTPTPTPTVTPTPAPTLTICPTPIPESGITYSGLTIYTNGTTASYLGTGATWTSIATGTTYNGTLINGPVFTCGNPSYFTFDGTNEWVDFGASSAPSLTNTNSYSFGGWVKSTTSATQKIFFMRGNDNTGAWSLNLTKESNNILTASAVLTFPGNTQISTNSTTTLVDNTWYYVIGVWFPSNYLKIYVNGSLEGTTNTIFSILRNAGSSGWNLMRSNSTGYTDGDVGEFEVYSRVLSGTEILDNFNGTKQKYGY